MAFFCPLFRFFASNFPHFPDKRKTLLRDDDDDNDDVFSNDDDNEFGVVLEIEHQTTPITAYYY